MTPIKAGTRVEYTHYGATKQGTVESTSRDGSIVFLKGGPCDICQPSVCRLSGDSMKQPKLNISPPSDFERSTEISLRQELRCFREACQSDLLSVLCILTGFLILLALTGLLIVALG